MQHPTQASQAKAESQKTISSPDWCLKVADHGPILCLGSEVNPTDKCLKLLKCLERHIRQCLSDRGREYPFTRKDLLVRWQTHGILPFSLLSRDTIEEISSHGANLPRAIELAKAFLEKLKKKFPNQQIDLEGVGLSTLVYSLPLLVDYWDVLSDASQQAIVSLVGFSMDLKKDEILLPPGSDPTHNVNKAFYASICDLFTLTKITGYNSEDPPESILLNYSLENTDAIAVLKTLIATQPHTREWIIKHYDKAVQRVKGNTEAAELISLLKLI